MQSNQIKIVSDSLLTESMFSLGWFQDFCRVNAMTPVVLEHRVQKLAWFQDVESKKDLIWYIFKVIYKWKLLIILNNNIPNIVPQVGFLSRSLIHGLFRGRGWVFSIWFFSCICSMRNANLFRPLTSSPSIKMIEKESEIASYSHLISSICVSKNSLSKRECSLFLGINYHTYQTKLP